MLDHPVRLGLDLVARRDHVARVVELELRLGALDRERAARQPRRRAAAPASARASASGSATASGACSAPGEHAVDLARRSSRASERIGCGRRTRCARAPPGPIEISTVTARRGTPGHEAARLVREGARAASARPRPARRRCCRAAAPPRRAPSPGRTNAGDVGDVHVAGAARRRRARPRARRRSPSRVTGSIVKVGSSVRSRRGSSSGRAAAWPRLVLDRVAGSGDGGRGRTAAPRRRRARRRGGPASAPPPARPAPPAARARGARSTRSPIRTSRRRRRSTAILRAALEERLDDRQAAALGEDADAGRRVRRSASAAPARLIPRARRGRPACSSARCERLVGPRVGIVRARARPA